MLGSILGAVSPAVVVPLMIKFIEEKEVLIKAFLLYSWFSAMML